MELTLAARRLWAALAAVLVQAEAHELALFHRDRFCPECLALPDPPSEDQPA